MNVGKVKGLIQERSKMDPHNDVLASHNQEQLLEIFKNNLTDSIEFSDSCFAEDLYWISEIFDDLSDYFNHQN